MIYMHCFSNVKNWKYFGFPLTRKHFWQVPGLVDQYRHKQETITAKYLIVFYCSREPSLAVSPTESGPDDAINPYPLPVTSATTTRRSASSDLLKSISPKAHFNSLKAWGKKNKLLRFIKKGGGGGETKSPDSPEDNVYETIRRNKTTQVNFIISPMDATCHNSSRYWLNLS